MFLTSLANLFAQGINPALAALVLAAPLIERGIVPWLAGVPGRKPVSFAWYLARAILGLAIAVALAESGKRYVIWPGHPSFPSGHETFAAATATALVLRNPRWTVVAVPLALLMAWALVRAGFHDVPDVCGGLALGTIVTLAAWAVIRPRRPRATPPDT